MSASLISANVRLRKELRTLLEPEGFKVWEAASEDQATKHLRQHPFRLIMLDLDSAEHGRHEAVKALKTVSGAPLIALSRTDDDADVVNALAHGADDFIVMPFNPRVLLARIYANTRMLGPARPPAVAYVLNGPVRIDPQRHEVRIRDRIVAFSPKEFEIFRLLVAHKGEPLANKHLLREVWGEHRANDKHYLRVYISQIRKKLAPVNLQHSISCVPHRGYRMDPLAEDDAPTRPLDPAVSS